MRHTAKAYFGSTLHGGVTQDPASSSPTCVVDSIEHPPLFVQLVTPSRLDSIPGLTHSESNLNLNRTALERVTDRSPSGVYATTVDASWEN